MSDINSRRRYYLLARQYYANVVEDTTMAGAIRSKQEAIPGTALPDNFPFKARLAAPNLGYTTVEDLNGADVRELIYNGFTGREANAILARLQTLL